MNHQMLYSPKQLELVRPLIKWKVLALENLNEASWRKDRNSNFYKTVEGLEKKGVIHAFNDSISKRKYVYLTAAGMESLAVKNLIPINKESFIHDTFASELAFLFRGFPFTKEVLLDHEILSRYPMIGHRPDALIFGHHKKDFSMAIEMELTIKSKDRIMETFSYYASSEFFNNVLYVFGSEDAYKTYIRVLENEGKDLSKTKFLFVFMQDMYRRQYEIFNSPCYHNATMTTLGKLFGIVDKQWNESGAHSN